MPRTVALESAPEPKPTRLHPLKEAQQRLGGISRAKLYLEVDQGRLKLSRIGRRVFVSDVELDRYLQSVA